EVDDVVRLLQDGRLPRAEGRHGGAGAAAGDQLEVAVEGAHGAGGLGGEPAVLVRGLVPGLPGAVHLVAEAPHADVVRLLGAVGDAQVGQGGAGRVVAVRQQVDGLGDAAGAEVDRHHGLHPGLAAPADELV